MSQIGHVRQARGFALLILRTSEVLPAVLPLERDRAVWEIPGPLGTLLRYLYEPHTRAIGLHAISCG